MPYDPVDLPPLATPADVSAVQNQVTQLRADFEAYKSHVHGAVPPPSAATSPTPPAATASATAGTGAAD